MGFDYLLFIYSNKNNVLINNLFSYFLGYYHGIKKKGGLLYEFIN